MKKCSYCGKKYSDEMAICEIDQMPLEMDIPENSVSVSRSLLEKIIFTILWMAISFIVGLIILAATLAIAFIKGPPPHLPSTSPEMQFWTRLIMFVYFVFPIGLPFLSLILGIFGKLPGTRNKAQL